MAWNNPNGLVVAGRGEVYVAPVGSTLPTSPTAQIPPAYTGLGYHSDDGVSTNAQPEFEEVPVWQSPYPARRVRTTDAFTLTFALMQWDENSVPFAFGGGSIDSVTGGFKFSPPKVDSTIAERALICDVNDGTDVLRFVIPRGTVTENVESQFRRNSAAELPVTFKALEPGDGGESWYFLTNSADFQPGS